MAIYLSDEITNDPLARGYAGMTRVQVAESLNAKNLDYYIPLGSSELNKWSMSGPGMKLRRAIQADTAGDAILSICYGALNMLERENSAFDANNSDEIAMIDALVTATIFDAADKTSLLALATKQRSRAEELRIQDQVYLAPNCMRMRIPVREDHIRIARGQ